MNKINIWKYNPVFIRGLEKVEDISTFKDNVGSLFITTFQKFFSNPEIQQLVEENEWRRIFGYWDGVSTLNKPGWILDILLVTLYFLGIDFWSYLPEDFNPDKYYLRDKNCFYK